MQKLVIIISLLFSINVYPSQKPRNNNNNNSNLLTKIKQTLATQGELTINDDESELEDISLKEFAKSEQNLDDLDIYPVE